MSQLNKYKIIPDDWRLNLRLAHLKNILTGTDSATINLAIPDNQLIIFECLLLSKPKSLNICSAKDQSKDP